MKKLIFISLVILTSCKEESSPVAKESFIADTIVTPTSLPVDSISEKISNLLESTEHVDKKVNEIKAIKKENVNLKKELVETKTELQQVKAVLADTTSESSKIRKKSFIQKVISTIKKDTVQ
jgi:uncharacterized coiled-coil DUF342 family protein